MAALWKMILLSPDGDRECMAAPTEVPGLYVAAWQAGPPSRQWTVTHHSGIGVATDLPDPEAALAAASDLGALMAWDRPAAEINAAILADPELSGRVITIAERWGGDCIGHEAGPDLIERASA